MNDIGVRVSDDVQKDVESSEQVRQGIVVVKPGSDKRVDMDKQSSLESLACVESDLSFVDHEEDVMVKDEDKLVHLGLLL